VFISCTQRVSMKKNLDKISLEIAFVGSLWSSNNHFWSQACSSLSVICSFN
jgi:hypothetical protein